eukprot:7386049-Prymnesium_polylepis.2
MDLANSPESTHGLVRASSMQRAASFAMKITRNSVDSTRRTKPHDAIVKIKKGDALVDIQHVEAQRARYGDDGRWPIEAKVAYD